jgi:UDP-3-O-[3-hydroxymyristoyl] N-acetylglucosamine deacetylase
VECQQTLRTSIRATGAGSCTGDRVDLILRPAPVDTGVVFRRVDLPEPVAIPARVEHADGTLLSTTLQRGSIAVSAVEHLLAAAAGLGIDNLYVDITGPELPHLDGSAGPFVFLIQSAGIEAQPAPRRLIRVLKPVQCSEGGAWARLSAYDGLKIALGDASPAGGRFDPQAELDVTETSFIKELSRARRPGSATATHSVSGPADPEPQELPRFHDEALRNRILSALADLSLAGARIRGRLEGAGRSNGLYQKLLRSLLADPEAWVLESDMAEPERVSGSGSA